MSAFALFIFGGKEAVSRVFVEMFASAVNSMSQGFSACPPGNSNVKSNSRAAEARLARKSGES
jgi:hypothetical protein